MLARAFGHLVLLLCLTQTADAFNQPASDPMATDEVDLLYRANQGQNLWVRFGHPTPIARSALRVLAEAHSHGLNPGDYQADLLHVLHESLLQGASDQADRFEIEMSRSLLRLIADMRPADYVPLSPESRGQALALELLDAIYADELDRLLERLAPTDPQYAALRGALREHDRQTRRDRQVQVGRGANLALGDRGERVARLRMRLLGLADRAYGEDERSTFDESLEEAVVAYQTMHGLEADGVVGVTTIQHLDTSPAARRAQIRLNLDRWRRLPRNLGRDHVLINIPEYRLRLVREHEERLSMRVVVGAQSNQTPEFADAIEYLVFNPYWYVPRSIIRNELAPAQAKSGTYLSKNGYELLTDTGTLDPADVAWTAETLASFPYGVRQKPGPGNALGGLKFVLPNALDIYLHDSPARQLYSRAQRAFSHGCIRLEYPQLLAQALLEEDPEWTGPRISSTITAGKTRQVNLRESVPIYLVYMTVRVRDDGAVAFFDDVYRRDQKTLTHYM